LFKIFSKNREVLCKSYYHFSTFCRDELSRKSRNNMQTFPRGDVQRNSSVFKVTASFFPSRWGKQSQKRSDECGLARVNTKCLLNHSHHHSHHHFTPPLHGVTLLQNCSNSPLSNIQATNSQPTIRVVMALFHSFTNESESFDYWNTSSWGKVVEWKMISFNLDRKIDFVEVFKNLIYIWKFG